MAEIVWSDKAVSDLDEIVEYIAFENLEAAIRLARRIESHLDQLMDHPLSGPVPTEDPSGLYRQISERPCRVIYRYDGMNVIIVRILRAERLLRPSFFIDAE